MLLISVDTLRADRLGSYGYAAAATPNLDALAARGLRFSQATTTVPLTLPAHTSLLTGTFPTFHGVRDNGSFYVDDTLTTLAETLKGQGFRTGGFFGIHIFPETEVSIDLEGNLNFLYDIDLDIAGVRATAYIQVQGWIR